MMNEPNFGSSEYSEAAEELFAQYVTRREEGEEIDFEEYCAAHENRADELYGLHADWDNVASLLQRVEAKRRAAAPEPEPEIAPAQEPEPDPEPVPAAPSAPPPPRRESPRWKLLSGFGLLLALAIGGFAVTLFRTNGVLAMEKVSLTEEKQQLTSESAEREQARLSLAGQLATARAELATTREQLKTEQQRLADEQQKVTDEQERVTAERQQKEQAQLEAIQATARAEELATRLQLDALTREAETLLPAVPELAGALEAWLNQAGSLTAGGEEDQSGLDGARKQIEARLSMLERVQASQAERYAVTWSEAIEAIADPQQNPVYAGLVLEPQFALLPLGPDPESGRWLFADLRTGDAQEANRTALIFQLMPGTPDQDQPVPPFFIATTTVDEAHWEFAGIAPEHAELGYSPPTPAQARLAGSDEGLVLPLTSR